MASADSESALTVKDEEDLKTYFVVEPSVKKEVSDFYSDSENVSESYIIGI